MADNTGLGILGIMALIIVFLASKTSVGTQSAFGGFGASFFSTTPGLVLLGAGAFVLVIVAFIPKEGGR